MRLTVHHSHDIAPQWLQSLETLLAASHLTVDQALLLGDWHLATFNERVVGMAITRYDQLCFVAVRDITRRRGVGCYLIQQTLDWQRNHHVPQSWIDTVSVPDGERSGLENFLAAQGFTLQDGHWQYPLK